MSAADPRCPRCPGPRVPHHCGKALALCTVGKGKGVNGGKGLGKGRGKANQGTSTQSLGLGGKAPGQGATVVKRQERLLFFRCQLDSAFPLRGRLLGQGGEHLRQIRERTGVRVLLEGPAGNPQDADSCPDSAQLQLRVMGCQGRDFEDGVNLVKSLMDETLKDHDDFVERRKAAAATAAAAAAATAAASAAAAGDDNGQAGEEPEHCEGKREGEREGKEEAKGKGKGKGKGPGRGEGKGEGDGVGRGQGQERSKGKSLGKGKARDRTSAVEEIQALEGEADPAFPLRGRLLGEGGQNFRYICQEARVSISLRGSGARRKGEGKGEAEGKGGEEDDADGPLRLRVTAPDQSALASAMEMVRDLLQEVRKDHDSWVANRASRPARQGQRGGEAAMKLAEERCRTQAARLHEEAVRCRAKAERLTAAVAKTGAPAAMLLDSLQQRAAAPVPLDGNGDGEGGHDDDTRGSSALQQPQNPSSVAQSASARFPNGKAFWAALESQLRDRNSSVQKRTSLARAAEGKATALERQAESCVAAVRAGACMAGGTRSGVGRMGGFCALYPMQACPFGDRDCPRGQHGEPPAPSPQDALVRITRAKKRLLQQKWCDAGGRGELLNAWQVRNPRLEFLFRASECDFAAALGSCSDVIDGWHGTAEANVLSIAVNGFDPGRRSGQVYGAGEYFAKDPNVSIGYARGGGFMFLCKLLLGQEGQDHTWVDTAKYYVLKQRDCRVQAMPLFLVQFRGSTGGLGKRLESVRVKDTEDAGVLAVSQRGGLRPCEARRDAGMAAESTRHLWVGWLAPELCHEDDDAVTADVQAFLKGLVVQQVVPERNGARIGAFVLLASPIDRAAFAALRARRYRGEFRISVDDQQPGNPRCTGQACPRLTGPSHYCRGWNLRGHHAWQWGCPFAHPEEARPTHGASYSLEKVPRGSAKYDEIETELQRSAPFVSADGSSGRPRIVAVRRVVNLALQRLYEERRGFLHDKHGFAVEKELWHGTNCKALPELLTHGLQPPSDTRPSDACPHSGKKGLCTTLCGTSCPHCTKAHCWDRCHMYGLGVYMADLAQKSHRYVREPSAQQPGHTTAASTGRWETMLAGQWRSFDEDRQAQLEAARVAGKDLVSFSARGWSYQVNFTRMVQINLSTHRERPVRRVDTGDASMPSPPPTPYSKKGPAVYSMLRCKVCLGNPYLIEGNLLKGDAMHDMCWCQDPVDALESCAEPWGVAKGHDAFYVKGMSGSQKAGLGVYNSEYIVFQPYQLLPLYQVDYVLD